jgi:hypothetical protein
MFTENLMPDRLEEGAKGAANSKIYELGLNHKLPALLPVAQISNLQSPVRLKLCNTQNDK